MACIASGGVERRGLIQYVHHEPAVQSGQGLLKGLGWVLAGIYDVIPNYGITIILLTVLIRVVLLPLGIKQVKSMQRVQALQPKIKAIQQKYKGNRQKIQEEQMKLYQEMGFNEIGMRKDYYPARNGREDALVMARVL